MTAVAIRILLLTCLVLVPVGALAQDKKVALVVGMSAYEATTPLPNTVNDANGVAGALERLGFTVFPAIDETQAGLLGVMGDFSAALEGADAAVFFYAGHAIQIDGENYMLPVDINPESELTIRYGSVSLTDVLREVESRARVAVLVLDACRNNPFEDAIAAADPTRSLGTTRGLAPMQPSGNGAIIAYAAASGQVAADGAGSNSPYTEALLKEMEQPGVEVGLMFRRVAGRVIETTGGEQRPEVLIRLASEYYLAEVEAVPVQEVDEAAVAPVVPATEEPAPIDIVIADDFGLDEEPIEVAETEEVVYAREVVEATGDRPALWDYASTLVVSPPDIPGKAWVPPPSRPLASKRPFSSFQPPLGPSSPIR